MIIIEELLKKIPNETSLEHHRRLIYGKLRDKTIDEDYSELAEELYGQPYSADATRKMAYGSYKTLQLLDEERHSSMDSEALCELERKEIEVRKLTQRFRDQRTAYDKMVRDQARLDDLYELIAQAIKESDLPSFVLPRRETFYKQSDDETDLIICLSDIHYGLAVDNYWTRFDSSVCSQMMERYVDKILKIASRHNSRRCVVTGLGDFISGTIHLPIALQNKENLVQQIIGVSELIANALWCLANYFEEVRFISVAGNHSRVAKKEDARVDERLDDLIGFYLKARFEQVPNVRIEEAAGEKIDSTMARVDVMGKNYILVHGDFDSTPSGVQALCSMVNKPVYGVLCGHKHHSYSETMQGIRIVMSGSFIGTDDYAVSKRLLSFPEQTVLVCDQEGIVCQYNVSLK